MAERLFHGPASFYHAELRTYFPAFHLTARGFNNPPFHRDLAIAFESGPAKRSRSLGLWHSNMYIIYRRNFGLIDVKSSAERRDCSTDTREYREIMNGNIKLAARMNVKIAFHSARRIYLRPTHIARDKYPVRCYAASSRRVETRIKNLLSVRIPRGRFRCGGRPAGGSRFFACYSRTSVGRGVSLVVCYCYEYSSRGNGNSARGKMIDANVGLNLCSLLGKHSAA